MSIENRQPLHPQITVAIAARGRGQVARVLREVARRKGCEPRQRFWRDQGRRTEARELLATVYGRFAEGIDAKPLRDAKSPLTVLA